MGLKWRGIGNEVGVWLWMRGLGMQLGMGVGGGTGNEAGRTVGLGLSKVRHGGDGEVGQEQLQGGRLANRLMAHLHSGCAARHLETPHDSPTASSTIRGHQLGRWERTRSWEMLVRWSITKLTASYPTPHPSHATLGTTLGTVHRAMHHNGQLLCLFRSLPCPPPRHIRNAPRRSSLHSAVEGRVPRPPY